MALGIREMRFAKRSFLLVIAGAACPTLWPVSQQAAAGDQPLTQGSLQGPEADAVQLPAKKLGRAAYIDNVTREARKWGLPPEIADAVMNIESGYNPQVVGSVGEIGLMQVRPETAAMLGFKGTLADLAAPETNMELGVRYLAGAWRLADGDICRTLMKYRAGHGEEWLSPLSVNYCRRARSYLASIGSPLAAQISLDALPSGASVGEAGAAAASPGDNVSRQRSRALAQFYRYSGGSGLAGWPLRLVALPIPKGRPRTERDSLHFWAAHDARVKAITARIEARWRSRAARRV